MRGPLRAEILYFEGYPSYEEAEKTLKEVLSEQGAEAKVTMVAVATDEEVQRHRFPGSPTMRVDGTGLLGRRSRTARTLLPMILFARAGDLL